MDMGVKIFIEVSPWSLDTHVVFIQQSTTDASDYPIVLVKMNSNMALAQLMKDMQVRLSQYLVH
jgi:hypothetical protein